MKGDGRPVLPRADRLPRFRRRARVAAVAGGLLAVSLLAGCVLGSSEGPWRKIGTFIGVDFMTKDLFMVRSWVIQARDDGSGGEDIRRQGCHDQYFDGTGKPDEELPELIGLDCPDILYQQGDLVVLGIAEWGKTLKVFNAATRKFEAPIVQDSGRLQFLDDKGEILHFEGGLLKERKSGRVLRSGEDWKADGFATGAEFMWTWRDTATGCSYALARKSEEVFSSSQVRLCGAAGDSLTVLWTRKIGTYSTIYYNQFGNVPLYQGNLQDPGEVADWEGIERFLNSRPPAALATDLPRRRLVLGDTSKTFRVTVPGDTAVDFSFTYIR